MTEHVADAVVPASVQSEPVKVPVPVLVTSTVPLGVVSNPVAVSVTVTVHSVDEPDATIVGTQEILVVVEWMLTVTVVVPVLPLWAGVALSPP